MQLRLTLAAALLAALPAPAAVGPIPATVPAGNPSHDYPFYAATLDLAARGYVEQEFFVEGTANRYATHPLADATVIDGGHRFRTRIVVRRPSSAARFNGTAILEWDNVTAGHDLDIDWYQAHDYFVRAGYAWIGVSAQRVGVEALKAWSPTRYGSLDVTDRGAVMDDALSYDIFASVARLVRRPSGVDVLGGLNAARVFATGHSQSASRLATYVNSVHPLAPVFDAVVIHGGGGPIRTDLRVKVWKLLSETDVINGQGAVRQPDTGTLRTWEVAGDSHVDLQFATASRALTERDGSPLPEGFRPGLSGSSSSRGSTGSGGSGSSRGSPSSSSMGAQSAAATPCERPPYSHVPFYQVMAAAFDHLVAWVKDGTPPPAAPRIEITSAGPPAVIARDARGVALGGIRLAEIEAPTGVNTGVNAGPVFCRLYGSYEPFDAPTLAQLYPTHAAYVARVKAATERNLRAGYILKADADATIAEAERSTIGARR